MARHGWGMANGLWTVKRDQGRALTIATNSSFDVIVIGAGMAGSIAAAKCGRHGLTTLVLERGDDPKVVPKIKNPIRRALAEPDARSGERWPRNLMIRREEGAKAREIAPILGIGPGGSGRIYGAALGRAARCDFEEDFQPAQWGAGDETALPNSWPVDYGEFLGAYREVEGILSLAGTPDPLDPDDDAELRAPPPISPAHHAIVERLESNGRHPYRMHVGIAYRPGCSECQGLTCMRDCKAHGYNRALEPAIRDGAPIEIRKSSQVQSITRAGASEWKVSYRSEEGEECVSARHVVLAAGALNSPRILQASSGIWDKKLPDLIGRGLMFHASEIFAVEPPDPTMLFGPRKVLAFRDHYRDGPMPLGECQSLGMTAKSGMIANFLNNRLRLSGVDLGKGGKLALRPVGEVAEKLYGKTELFTAALQDLPYAESRVFTERGEDGTDRISIVYRPREELIARIVRFRDLMREAFQPLKVTFLSATGEPNLGHPMGTCRMGSSPDHSVVDAQGQVWDQPGLYVADASAFPSSLGINPALTAAAHATRVAEAIISQRSAKP